MRHCALSGIRLRLPRRSSLRLLIVTLPWIAPASFAQQASAAELTAGNYLVKSDAWVYEVDRLTGDREFVIGPSIELGPNAALSGAIAIDADWNIYVSNAVDESIYRFEPGTGALTVVSGAAQDGIIGAGPDLDFPIGLALGPQGELFVADRDLRAVVSIDVLTGDRSIISGGPNNIGQGADAFRPHDLLLLPSGELLAGGSQMNALVAVDLNTGDRVPVSRSGPNAIGNGPDFSSNGRLSLGSAGRVLMSGGMPLPGGLGVFEVDLATGNRTLLFPAPYGMLPLDIYYEVDGRLLILDSGIDPSIRRFDPNSGELQYFSYSDSSRPFDPIVGEGPPLRNPDFIVQIPARVPEPATWVVAVPIAVMALQSGKDRPVAARLRH